jgi:ABC-type multidrug transport system fused ATPase/permease subunit
MPKPEAASQTIAKILRKLKPSRRRVALTLSLVLGAGVLEGATIGLLVPLLAVLTSSTPNAPLPVVGQWLEWVPPTRRIAALAVAITLLALLKNSLAILGSRSAGVLRAGMLIELRRQLLSQVLHAPPATLEQHTSGEITTVFVAESYRVSRFIEACLVFLQRSIIGLSYVAAMLALSWRLTAATILLGALIALVAARLGRNVMRHGRELSRAGSQLGRQVSEIVGGLRVIRTTASERSHAAAFAEPSAAHAHADAGSGSALALQQAGIESLGVAGAVVLVTLAHRLWLSSGALDVAHFLAFGFGLVRLLPALNVVYATYGAIVVTIGAIERTLRWLELPSYPSRPFGQAKLPRLGRGIAFENVGFSYANGHTPLRGLSFVLPVGETLAIVGPSGTGKTTLASLLLRLREPTTGRITFDGVDYWEFAPAEFHRSIGFVDQEPFLFNASIAENVSAGREGIDRDAIIRALRLVQLGELIDRLPDGIDTLLAERGATLSGGQRQRVAIARAVVTDPQVLVLDEPTSALDLETEQEVMHAVAAASVGRTTLIITHRSAVLEHASLQLDLATGTMSELRQEPATKTQAIR